MAGVSADLPTFGTSDMNVTGVIVDYDKFDNVVLVILKDHKGWDRNEAYPPAHILSKRMQAWINNFDKSYAVIFVNKNIKKELSKGHRLTIDGYRYFYAGLISPSYDKFMVTK